MRFLIDMNLSPLWADVLHGAGYEAVHWSSVGRGDAADEELMAYARDHVLVVFTHDLDFGALLAHSGSSGPSVVQIREQDVDPARIGATVVASLRQCEAALVEGALVTIDLARAKARILPIRR